MMDDNGNQLYAKEGEYFVPVNPRIFGSVDNGATDTEYTPRPERILSAADAQFATHTELDAAIADTWTVMDELEARIDKLEARLAPPVTISQRNLSARADALDWIDYADAASGFAE